MRPLDDIVVLDLSRVLAGPYASMALADMGARILKIEEPGKGDDTRAFGPPFAGEPTLNGRGESTYFMSVNRGKESITVDMKHPRGKELIRRLAMKADVVLENFRPGVLIKLGLGPDDLRSLNPRLICCSISGYGTAGLPEYSSKPGYDPVAQGLGGLASVTGAKDGEPFKAGFSIADVTAGMLAVQGILLALYARTRTGRGQTVDISLLDGQVSLMAYHSTSTGFTQKAPTRHGNGHPNIVPFGTFKAADGYLTIGVANDGLFKTFATLCGKPQWLDDARFQTNAARVENRVAMEEEVAPIVVTRTVEAWVKLLDGAGIPAGPVLNVWQAMNHPQVRARGMVVETQHPTAGTIRMTGVPVKLSGTPGEPRGRPPLLGEHTESALRDVLGLNGSEFDELKKSGALGNR
ncbi:MAG: CoA transferase [Deltaproteobacteria bacterium]|nr:CoA transferase [Deltaproteobacteria bacterium]